MKTVPTVKLTQEGCDIIVNAAIEKAKELKQLVSVCVVDAGGHLMTFKRMTNGRTHNTLIAQAKARSAALTTAATGKIARDGSEIPDHLALAQTLAVGPGWFVSIEGGIPIAIDGQCIGAIGVSGAPSAVDRQIAQAGVEAFNQA
ncbi:MAG TPA: heme-binding protein [Candidatus Binatia bacterium]|nr:heme-binding protein [Candidatus Binatia bacterium]